jgi:hypothetical protein
MYAITTPFLTGERARVETVKECNGNTCNTFIANDCFWVSGVCRDPEGTDSTTAADNCYRCYYDSCFYTVILF